MPDLESQIAEWRRQMLAAGIRSPVPLDELEEHLREDMEAQTCSGMDAQCAFKTAVQRIGPALELKSEFQKCPKTTSMKQNLINVLVIVSVLAIGAALIMPAVAKWHKDGTLAGANLGFFLLGTAIFAWGVVCGVMAIVAALRKRGKA